MHLRPVSHPMALADVSPSDSQALHSGDVVCASSPFENSMDVLAASSSISPEKRATFVQYLLSNPCNVALRASHRYGNRTAGDWPSALAAAISSSSPAAPAAAPSTAMPRHVSWELLLCLMRNILCHEYCFEFRCWAWFEIGREFLRFS